MAEEKQKMTFWQHLNELRKRLFIALIGLVAGIVISIVASDFLLELLAKPIGGFEELQSIEVTENIGVFMRVSLLGGFIIALPFILYQLYLFIIPALKKEEQRWVLVAVPMAVILFALGAAFAYLVMLPAAIPVLVQFKGPEVLPRWNDYVSFITSLIFWSGISFELPLVAFILAKLKIISAKQLLKGWRVAVLVISIAAAVITPTGDPINMALLMLPLLILYGLSILLASIARK
jgi:sec-independent protein translocase protein TatC